MVIFENLPLSRENAYFIFILPCSVQFSPFSLPSISFFNRSFTFLNLLFPALIYLDVLLPPEEDVSPLGGNRVNSVDCSFGNPLSHFSVHWEIKNHCKFCLFLSDYYLLRGNNQLLLNLKMNKSMVGDWFLTLSLGILTTELSSQNEFFFILTQWISNI